MTNHVFSPLPAIHRGFNLQGKISYSFYCHSSEVPNKRHLQRGLGADLSEMCRRWAIPYVINLTSRSLRNKSSKGNLLKS